MSDSSQEFDVTTEQGRKNALAMIASPFLIYYWLGKTLFDCVSSLTSSANEKEIESPRKAAIDII